MEEQAALALTEDAIKEMNQELRPLARECKRMKGRLEGMAVFAARLGPQGGNVKERAEIELESTPEEELFFQHRKYYENTTKLFETLRERVEEMTIDSEEAAESCRKLTNMAQQLEQKANLHLKSMNEILVGLRKMIADKEAKMITITQERAKLMQAALQHADKMAVAREQRPTDDLVQNLAKKYGMTIEQVNDMVAAKPALTTEMEALKTEGPNG